MFAHLPRDVTIYEVGPRDGLQNEPRPVSTADKVAFIDALSATGLPAIEITSFVNPKWIPQLADASEVARAIQRAPGLRYSCLVPNRQGLDKALAAGMKEVAVFLSASETHNKKNVNKTIAETLHAFDEVIRPSHDAGAKVRAYVSTVYGCPYEGHVDPQAVVDLSQELRRRGVYQISLGDTIGAGTPLQVRDVLERVLAVIPAPEIAVHFHDTRGTALANILVALDLGIATVDSALGGLGGCPYAPGASGNVATEDVVYMLHGMGIRTGVDLEALCTASVKVSSLVGHEMPSKYLKAHLGLKARGDRRRPTPAGSGTAGGGGPAGGPFTKTGA
ncbi:MAG: hydroxymethylglutaryl-CoA lyase [Myxococcales bacterium]|nr:hydroxymethylglutaryl-CoA lyase [Myxococcales bacterium]